MIALVRASLLAAVFFREASSAAASLAIRIVHSIRNRFCLIEVDGESVVSDFAVRVKSLVLFSTVFTETVACGGREGLSSSAAPEVAQMARELLTGDRYYGCSIGSAKLSTVAT